MIYSDGKNSITRVPELMFNWFDNKYLKKIKNIVTDKKNQYLIVNPSLTDC